MHRRTPKTRMSIVAQHWNKQGFSECIIPLGSCAAVTGPDQWLLLVIIDFSQHSSPEHCHLQPQRQADSSWYIFHSQREKKNIFLVNINFSDLGSCRAKEEKNCPLRIDICSHHGTYCSENITNKTRNSQM